MMKSFGMISTKYYICWYIILEIWQNFTAFDFSKKKINLWDGGSSKYRATNFQTFLDDGETLNETKRSMHNSFAVGQPRNNCYNVPISLTTVLDVYR
jgi:hypothetical protein